MTTPLVCLLSRPAGAPDDSVQYHYQHPALTPQEQASLLAWSDRPVGSFPRDGADQALAVFHYQPLPSGRLALGRLWYLEANADEPERILLHALVFEPDELPAYPLDYQDWDGWWTQASPPPEPGPLEAQTPRLEYLRTFLAGVPARESAAVLLLAGLLSRDRHGRTLLVRDLPEWGGTWMHCIQRLLPPAHALNLSLCSHLPEDHQPRLALCATSPHSALNYRQVQQGEAYFIADLVGRQRSTLPPYDPLVQIARRCATRLVHWALEAPHRLNEFHDFVTAVFRHEALTPELWWMLRLFEASHEGPSLEADEVEPVLDILAYYTRPEAWEGIIGLLDTLLPQLSQNQRISDDDALLGLCLTAASQNSQFPPQQQAFRQWLMMFDRYLLHGQELTTLMERYREVASLPLNDELHDQLLAAERLAQVQQQTATLEAAPLGAVGWVLLDSVLQRRYPLEHQQAWLEPLLLRLLQLPDGEAQLLWLLSRTAEATPSAALLHRAWNATTQDAALSHISQAALGKLLHTHLSQDPAAIALREAILAQGDEALLLAEWQHQLDISDAPLACFQVYRREVLEQLPDYHDRCFGRLCESLFERLSEGHRLSQAEDWLLGDEEDWWRLPDGLATRCLTLVNAHLPLLDQSPRSQRLSAQVFARTRELGQVLQPDIPQLRRSLAAAARGALEANEDWFHETRRALAGLNTSAHRQFLDGVLPDLLRQAPSAAYHARIIEHLDHPEGVLEGCYLQALRAPLRHPDPLSIAIALRFWIRADTPPGIHQRVRQCLLRGLSRWDNTNLATLGQILDRHPLDAQMTAAHWRRFWRELDEQRQQRSAILERQFQNLLKPLRRPQY